ncbi:TonB-dependent receptor plug domain-containing protein [Hymenobacter sp. BT683]|uniref:TonB-dependent receptor plug domain-containing protein n=1 Tax=Hymenobacter jeongseonensis TaxID=2791027 RepID=A0ABS0IM49_9BACT|nr:TonB-dependent receptor [Hymenobacter jeongseonensis]MBF9239277.1 TonB-dependent receptor plug domain-containing protein [Hymenobacter jeongseonensis]
MKNLVFFLLIGWLTGLRPALAQTTSPLDLPVSVTAANRPLPQVLTELAATYGIRFSYDPDLLRRQPPVSLRMEQQPLREVLDQLLRGSKLRYQLIGPQVVLQAIPNGVSSTQQGGVTISGHVTDKTSGEALIGASVSLAGPPATGTGSNVYGFYSLRLPVSPPAGEAQLRVRYLGYAPLEVPLAGLRRDTTIALRLEPLARELSEVEVAGNPVSALDQSDRLTLRGSELKQLPRLLGEADAVKALQLLPGVQAGREGSSDLSVRGGGPDQNLMLLDGVPVYNVSHLLGTFSVFNPDAVKSVELLKGSFPAQYGGRLSSVVDVRLKEGNNQRFGGEGAVGLISSKVLLEGPIGSEKTSFLLAARRTYLDVLTSAAAALSGESLGNYHFFDLNAKVNHTFSDRDKVYLSVYGGQDRFGDQQEFAGRADQNETQDFAMRWGNVTGALRWNHTFGPRLFANLTLTHSRYQFSQRTDFTQQNGESRLSRFSDYRSGIVDWGAKAEADFFANARHSIRFGASYTHHRFSPESFVLKTDSLTFQANAFSTIGTHEGYVYAEDRLQLSERLQASVGLHASGFQVNGTFYSSLQPRLALAYTAAHDLRLRASFVTMAQYLHLLSNVSTGNPTDIWVPATDKVKPQRSWQAALGAARPLGAQWELTADVYYKEMRDVTEFRDGADFVSDFLRSGPETNFGNLISAPYETRLVTGRGWSYGSEWLLRKRQGKTTGWLGYTLAWAWRQLPGINFDQQYPYAYDTRHSIAAVANHQLSPRLTLGGSFTYRTGFVTTLPTTSYKAYNEPVYQPGSSTPFVQNVEYLGQRNNYRLGAYHRLDLSLTHTKTKKWGTRTWNVSVYNAYNRQNPYFVRLSSAAAGITSRRQLYQVSLFPILPSVSYGFTF